MPPIKRTEWTEISERDEDHWGTHTHCPECEMPKHVSNAPDTLVGCAGCHLFGEVGVRSTDEGTNSYAVLWMIEEGEES